MKDGGGQCGLRRWRTKGQLPNITAMPQRPPPVHRRARREGTAEGGGRSTAAGKPQPRGVKDDRLQFDMKQMRQKHTSPRRSRPLLSSYNGPRVDWPLLRPIYHGERMARTEKSPQSLPLAHSFTHFLTRWLPSLCQIPSNGQSTRGPL